jgi:hypothetical protein
LEVHKARIGFAFVIISEIGAVFVAVSTDGPIVVLVFVRHFMELVFLLFWIVHVVFLFILLLVPDRIGIYINVFLVLTIIIRIRRHGKFHCPIIVLVVLTRRSLAFFVPRGLVDGAETLILGGNGCACGENEEDAGQEGG